MPAIGNRTEAMCETIINGLDVMAHTVDSFTQFATFAVVHGLIIKGAKLTIKLIFVHWVAYGVLVLYSLYKFFDAIFIQRRENRFFIADPKLHCHFVNLSYADNFNLWLKGTSQIDKAANSQRD